MSDLPKCKCGAYCGCFWDGDAYKCPECLMRERDELAAIVESQRVVLGHARDSIHGECVLTLTELLDKLDAALAVKESGQ